jgi:DNA mismatch repair protein MutS2
MLGLKDLRIVHGKGDGILREVTRNLLRSINSVARLEDEHADRGGAGVTLVTLKA